MNLLSSVQISRRDRVFMLILPALAAFIIYSFFVTRKAECTNPTIEPPTTVGGGRATQPRVAFPAYRR